MDLDNQKNVKDAAALYGCEDTLVILGTASTVDAANFAETVTDGDQSYTGPLARVSLRLPVYHVLDPLVKEQLDPETWEQHIGGREEKMHAVGLVSIVAWKRSLYGKSVL